MGIDRPNVAQASATFPAAALRGGTIEQSRDDAVRGLTSAPASPAYNCQRPAASGQRPAASGQRPAAMTCVRRPAGARKPASPTSAGSPRRSEPRPGRSRPRLSLLPVLALLLAGAVSPFGAVPASAAVLVSTIGQTDPSGFEYSGTSGGFSVAQGFMTGSSPLGYILSSIEVRVNVQTPPSTLRGELWSAAADGGPGAKIADLSSPTRVSTSGGANAYAAPSNTRLAADRKYFVVLYKTDAQVESVRAAGSTAEDAGGEPDWSIDDKPYLVFSSPPSGTWGRDTGHNLMIRVNGSAVPWTNLRVTPGDRRLTVSWTGLRVFSGDRVVRGYDVYYREAVCTKPKRWNAGSSGTPDWVPEFRDGVRVYELCDSANPNQPGPWMHHGAWAGSWDPIARQTTRVIDGLWPGVAYDVRVRVRTNKRDFPWLLARGTPSGGSSNARLLQIELIADQLEQ